MEETKVVETKALSIVEQAKSVKVIDSESYIAAGTIWKSIGEMITEVKNTFDPICDAANKAHKAATAKRAQFLDPLESMKKMVKGLMEKYDRDQEEKRLTEERRLQEIARKAEEEKRLIEFKRLEAIRKAEEKRLLNEAIAAEKAGQIELANQLTEEAEKTSEESRQETIKIIEEPVYVAPVMVPKEMPKVAGGPVFRTNWKFTVVNFKILPDEFKEANDVKIGQVVRAMKKETRIPGVEVYEERC